MGLTIPVFVNISSQYGVRLGQASVDLDLAFSACKAFIQVRWTWPFITKDSFTGLKKGFLSASCVT